MASSLIYALTDRVQVDLGNPPRITVEDMLHDRSVRLYDEMIENAEIAENCACSPCVVDALIYRRLAGILR